MSLAAERWATTSSPVADSVRPFSAKPVSICAHCGLPLVGTPAGKGPSYCCSGCALAHRITGGGEGHGQATGLLMAVGIGAFLAMNVMMLSFVLYSGRAEADRAAGEAWVRWALLALATPAMILLGAPFLSRGARGLMRGLLDTDSLIVIGVSAAFGLSVRSVLSGSGPLYLDTAMGILLFVTIGRYLEAVTRARTTDALAALVQQMPDTANVVRADGREERVHVSALAAGDRVRVRPGERIPVDGCVVLGEASVSQAEITGEPLPVTCKRGARVSACTLDLDGDLTVEVERVGSETTIARIAKMVEEARAGTYPLAPLVDRLVRVFAPLVLFIALATFTFWTFRVDVGTGLMNALAVLLIACPCAIGIAVPLASTAASGRAATAGVLVRSGEVFERLARSRRIFFDKTGTLSSGQLRLVEIVPAPGAQPERIVAIAAALEAGSEHPIARALCSPSTSGSSLTAQRSQPTVRDFRAISGRGVSGTVELDGRDHQALLGTAELIGGAPETNVPGTTAVHLALDGAWQATFLLRDEARESAADAVATLRGQGLALEVLSGDSVAATTAFASSFPGLAASGGLVPEAKLTRLREAVAAGDVPVMVGDGINDAPALSAAAVGVTLESGTDLAREVADATILGGDLRRLPWIRGLAVKTLRVAHINLFWAFFYNMIGLGLAVAGLLHPLFGAVAMVLSSLLVVLHSQRLGRYPLPEQVP